MTGEDGSRADDQSKAKVFISYSRRDMAFVDRLEQALEARGFKPLIDRAEIYAFEDWWRRIESLIVRADTIVFTLSPDSISSDICRKEVEFAASLHKRFAPIVCRRVDDKKVPEALARLNFIFFDDEARFDDSITRLTEALQTDIEWIRQHTDFGEQARRWLDGGRSGGLLLRSPLLEQAERWIASRPQGAPTPTAATQTFIAASRQGASRRRNILTGSLGAGLVLALGLAGLAYWQRTLAERNFNAAKLTVDAVVLDMAQGLRDIEGMKADTARRILGAAETAVGDLASRTGNNPEVERSQGAMYTLFALTYLRLGAMDLAASYAQKGLDLSRALVASQPAITQRRQDLARSLDATGDVRMAQGDQAGALAAYRESLDIRRAVAAADPTDAVSQHDLLVSQGKTGDIQRDQLKLADALPAYREQLEIARKLVARDADNMEWQHDLAGALDNIGAVLVMQGDLAGALAARKESLDIARALAAKDPTNTESKRTVLLVALGLGDVLMAQGNNADALVAYREAIDIARALVRKDSGNTQWQRDTVLCLDGVGDALWTENDRDGALASYREALGIGRTFATKEPGNPQWQRVMSVNLMKIGDTLYSQGDKTGTLAAYQESLGVARALAEKNPDNIEWQDHVTVMLIKVGDVKFQNGDAAGALASYQDASDNALKVVARKSGDASLQHQVFLSAFKVGNAKALAGDKPGALTAYQESLGVARKLAADNPGNAPGQIDLFIALYKAATLGDPSQARPLLTEALSVIARLEQEHELTDTQKGWPEMTRTALSQVP